MEVVKEKDSSRLFWCALNAIGIPSCTKTRNNLYLAKQRLFGIVCFALTTASLLFAVTVKTLLTHDFPLGSISFAIHSVGTSLMTISLFLKRQNLTVLRSAIKSYPKTTKHRGWFVLICITLAVASTAPFLFTVSYLFFTDWIEKYAFDFFPSPGIARTLLCVTNSIAGVFIHVSVPAWINCIFCGYILNWLDIISTFKDHIEIKMNLNDFVNVNNRSASLVLRSCLKLWRQTKLVRDTFSPILFYLVMTQFVTIFIVPATILTYKSEGTFELMTLLFHFLGYSSFFALTVHLASKVPEELEKISACFKDMYGKIIFRHNSTERTVHERIKLIMTQKPVYLSVGGFVDMKYGLILTTAGTLVTYGVLIFQTSKDVL